MIENEFNEEEELRYDVTREVFKMTFLFTNSLLRPTLHGLTVVPNDWGVNCSLGATFAHINMKMKGVGIPRDAEYVIIVCGTNYFQHLGVQIELEMRRLISTINNLSPNVNVSYSQQISANPNTLSCWEIN